MASYYRVEFRLHGYAKRYAKILIFDISKKFRVNGITRKRAVPHVTLFGPFTATNIMQVLSEIVDMSKKYDLIPFQICGFDFFNNHKKKVIYLNIKPSKNLERLREDISQRLLKITNTKSDYDSKRNFYFHATVAFKDIDSKFSKIWNYLKQKEQKNINQHLLRITILKGNKMFYEYDLMQKRLLNQRQSKNKVLWKRTIEILKQKTPDFRQDLEQKENILERIKHAIKRHFS